MSSTKVVFCLVGNRAFNNRSGKNRDTERQLSGLGSRVQISSLGREIPIFWLESYLKTFSVCVLIGRGSFSIKNLSKAVMSVGTFL